jgi:hypothetical protein
MITGEPSAASSSSTLNDMRPALLERDREIERLRQENLEIERLRQENLENERLRQENREIQRLRKEIQLLRLQLAGPVALNDQDFFDV